MADRESPFHYRFLAALAVLRLGDLLCRLGRHKMVPTGYGPWGRTGGDCERCGAGPLV